VNLLARVTIRTRLVVLVGAFMSVLLCSTLIASSSFGATADKARTSDQASKTLDALSTAYEGWQWDDDQANMYVALLGLRDASQQQLIDDTWAQSVDGHQIAIDQLKVARGLITVPAELAALDLIDADLVVYDGFTQQVRAAGQLGDVPTAVKAATVDNAVISVTLPNDFEALRDVKRQQVVEANDAVVSSAASGRQLSWILLAIGVATGLAFSIVLIISILKPLKETIVMLGHIGAHRFDARVPVRGTDELSQVATSLNAAADSLAAAKIADDASRERDSEQREHELEIKARTATLREAIGENSRALAAAAEEMQAVSQQMGAGSAETSSQVSMVSLATVEVNRSVEMVSLATEQMSESIHEIARNATEAAGVASQAVAAAHRTGETVSRLGVSSNDRRGDHRHRRGDEPPRAERDDRGGTGG
jgi:methyl-accepting chemotaxis protein